MFTGIIECVGTVREVSESGNGNKELTVEAPFTAELTLGQSVSHNGVCLTVTEITGTTFRVTAITETLERTNLGQLLPGSLINLERCMKADGRFDGHIVQGHVDSTALCTTIERKEGSWHYFFRYKPYPTFITVEKGSVCINGISLTVVESGEGSFSVAIIPYTMENTNMKEVKEGSLVNVEFDIIGKYLSKLHQKLT